MVHIPSSPPPPHRDPNQKLACAVEGCKGRVAQDCGRQRCKAHCEMEGGCQSKNHRVKPAPPPTARRSSLRGAQEPSSSGSVATAAPIPPGPQPPVPIDPRPNPRHASQMPAIFTETVRVSQELAERQRRADAEQREAANRARQTVTVRGWGQTSEDWDTSRSHTFQDGYTYPYFKITDDVLEAVGLLEGGGKGLEYYDVKAATWSGINKGYIHDMSKFPPYVFLRLRPNTTCVGLDLWLSKMATPQLYSNIAFERKAVRTALKATSTVSSVAAVATSSSLVVPTVTSSSSSSSSSSSGLLPTPATATSSLSSLSLPDEQAIQKRPRPQPRPRPIIRTPVSPSPQPDLQPESSATVAVVAVKAEQPLVLDAVAKHEPIEILSSPEVSQERKRPRHVSPISTSSTSDHSDTDSKGNVGNGTGPSKPLGVPQGSLSTAPIDLTAGDFKVWPDDFHVCEVSAFFVAKSKTMRGRSNSTPDAGARLHENLFRTYFGANAVYNRRRVSRAYQLWRQASSTLQATYVDLGPQKSALWSKFRDAVKASGDPSTAAEQILEISD
ncbi:hypothetical protein CC1G_12444 [Coprinopsis cinerea okayama7|uniref:Uncharacterized protein n=1 Tax=Coprinopsis cinerea (strain Okayama-7 / 130 / ATCC MYA-4618 / FGSC 9003) TaxID=240176 RepID=A8NSU0_COPC7|nr:hypothetical protein CC1G_12444 [Coprinopsis cinerea okayama7\|eukprot:XP_001836092.1 hypothetical protein CC1G_12444 [Coprinopsis cinerea okayama7\